VTANEVGKLADQFAFWPSHLGDNNYAYMEGRIQARVLEAFLTAEKIGAPSAAGNDWSQLLHTSLSQILSTQSPDGAYNFKARGGYNSPYMTGMVNEAMIDYYENFEADPRIITAVKKANDYLWVNNWNASAQAFEYAGGNAPTGGTNPAPDVNNLISPSFGWLYSVTGDATYKQRGDQIFAGGVNKAWLDGSKQFNQEYTTSYEYLGYTLKQPAAPTTQPLPSSDQPLPSTSQPLPSSTQAPSSGSINHAPQAVPDSGTVGENETKLFAVLANDADSDSGDTKTLKALGPVTVSSSNASVNHIDASSALSIENGQIKFNPGILFDKLGANEKATVVLPYTMEDNQHASSQSSLTIQVIGANEATVSTTSPTTTSLRGTNQSDTICGTTIAEQLYGLRGNNSLFGNSGNDTLDAGRGKDLICGGVGRDILKGGSDRDAFQFLSKQDSLPGFADTITDFRHSQGDKLDLSKIDANSQTPTDDHFSGRLDRGRGSSSQPFMIVTMRRSPLDRGF
jgi:Ca2+-binding RTX toxin-like protein